MADEEQKKLFSRNLNNYLLSNNRTQKEVADAIGVSPTNIQYLVPRNRSSQNGKGSIIS